MTGDDSADACFGLAVGALVVGREPGQRGPVHPGLRAVPPSGRRSSGAIECAVWLAITYKAELREHGRGQRVAGPGRPAAGALEPGPLHAWVWIARAYRMADLDRAEALTEQALALARAAGDVDLELGALAQIGLIRVGQGGHRRRVRPPRRGGGRGAGRRALQPRHRGLRLLRHAQRLRAGQRRGPGRAVVPGGRRFVEAYGSPFLYAECRILYGGVLVARDGGPTPNGS